MQCPSCKFEVSRGTAICPSCDEILDASVFDGSTSEADSFDEKTGDADIQELKPPPSLARPSKPPPVPASAPPPPAPRAQPALPGDPRRRAAAATAPPPPPSGKKGRQRRWERPTSSADEVLTDAWASFKDLPAFERLTIATLLFGSMAMLFPWRTTDTAGEEIGIFLVPIALLPLVIAAAAATVRMSADLRGFRPDQLSLIQLVCGIVLVGFCAYFFYQTLDAGVYRSSLGRLKLHTSTPEVGCIACGIAALGIAASGAWGYLEERGFE